MTPLLFISIVTLIILLMVFWVLSSIKDFSIRGDQKKLFDFESGQRLIDYVEPQSEDHIFLIIKDSMHMRAYWILSEEKWQESTARNTSKIELILRINKSKPIAKTYDHTIKDLSGEFDFIISPQSTYYASLGTNDEGHFIPIIFSNTINT